MTDDTTLPDAWVAEWGRNYEQADEKEAYWSENLAEAKVSEWKNEHDDTDGRWYGVSRYRLVIADGE